VGEGARHQELAVREEDEIDARHEGGGAAVARDAGEDGVELGRSLDVDEPHPDAGRARRRLVLAPHRRVRHRGASQDGDLSDLGQRFLDELQLLGPDLGRELVGQPGDVAAGAHETVHEAGADRIGHVHHHDGNGRAGADGGLGGDESGGDDDIDGQAGQPGHQRRETVQATFRPAVFDFDGAAPGLAQAVGERVGEVPGGGGRRGQQDAHARRPRPRLGARTGGGQHRQAHEREGERSQAQPRSARSRSIPLSRHRAISSRHAR